MTFLDSEEILKRYKKPGNLWSQKPNRFVVSIPRFVASGRVLDLGAGEGKNSVFLAEKGFNVTSVDISKEAIGKLLNLAQEKNVSLRTIIKDITKIEPKDQYDIVICLATLHLLKNEALTTIKKIKMWTKKNGLNVITAFTENDPGYVSHSHLYFFREDELELLYSDWQIIEYSIYSKTETHDTPHTHHLAAIVARKK